MAVIGVCIYDSPENNRHPGTVACVNSLLATVNLNRHKVILIDNGSPDWRTVEFLRRKSEVECVRFSENFYNHAAFNYTFQRTPEDEVAILIENDVVLLEHGWADYLEDVVKQAPFHVATICPPELPTMHQRDIEVQTHLINQQPREIVLAKNVWNGCTAFSPAARRRVGYFKPPREGYGFNDPLMSLRLERSGLLMGQVYDVRTQYTGNLNQTKAYTTWKRGQTKLGSEGFHQLSHAYRSGQRDTYEPMNPSIQIEENFYMNFWEQRGPTNMVMMGYLDGGVFEGLRDEIYGAVTEALASRDVKSVLDVGGNIALLGRHFKKVHYEPRYTVVDINPHAVEFSRNDGFEAVVGDAANLEDFRRNQRGAVTLLAVLDHMPHFEPGLREAFRVAKEAVVVVFWKNVPGDDEVIRYFKQGFYENTYKHDDILAVAEDCGWTLDEIQNLQGRDNVAERMYVFIPAEG